MLGVFGAGVATHLQDAEVYEDISAVYGTSAGAFIGAYFLSRQTKLGSSIFFEDLTHNFISVPSFCIGVVQRVLGHFTGNMPWNKLRDAFDIEYLLSVAKNVKPLDISCIEASQVPLYFKLFNLATKEVEYLDAHNVGVFHGLRAAVQLLPYTHVPERINGNDYMDAGNIETIGLERLRERHPHEKIVLVLNTDVCRKKFRRKWKKHIEGRIMSYMFGREFFPLYKSSEASLEEDIRLAQDNPKILIVTPPSRNRSLSRTTSPATLRATYTMGMEAGKDVVTFIQG